MEKLDSAYVVLEGAKRRVDEKDLAFLNTQLGYVFERKGQIEIAADYAMEYLRLGKKFNDTRAIAVAYSDLSNLFWKQSKYVQGLEYGLKSINIFEKRGIYDLDYDFTLYIVGNNFLALKKYREAHNYFEQSISIGERYGFYNNLCDVYISLIDYNAILNNFSEAEVVGLTAIKYAELLDNNFMLMRSWLAVGKLQYLQGKYITAIESLNKCLEIATDDFGDFYFLSQAYETLGKAYAGNHNYKDAYIAFEEYDKLKSKFFTSEADHRISLLQTEYEVAQKETTIQVQENELKKQRTRQTLISIITGLLFLLLSVLFITYRIDRKKNHLLEKQNKEKEFLLKEIHHRVKNNLGIVSSLLSLQSALIEDQEVKDVMEESENRVYSMSMIHQKLYQGKNIDSIEMKDYFINLGNHILDSYGMGSRINMNYDMEPIELDVDTAIPLGLIVNELLTNSLKYAFPNERKGEIVISLFEINNEILHLEVSDNGIGKDSDTLIRGTGFGMQLINLLVKQLEGKQKDTIKECTSFCFEFPHEQ
jgi:two-component sensor histidine kinase